MKEPEYSFEVQVKKPEPLLRSISLQYSPLLTQHTVFVFNFSFKSVQQ